MRGGWALPLAAAAVLAGAAGAWPDRSEEGGSDGDHWPACGGVAPVVDRCSTGTHVVYQFHGLPWFSFPPCGTGATPAVPKVAPVPCFVGDVQAVLHGDHGQWRRLCHVTAVGVPALDRMECQSRLEGFLPLWGAMTTHTCYARSLDSSTNAAAGEGTAGALGDWRCHMGWHS